LSDEREGEGENGMKILKTLFYFIYFENSTGDIVSLGKKGVTFLRDLRSRRSSLMAILLPDYGKGLSKVSRSGPYGSDRVIRSIYRVRSVSSLRFMLLSGRTRN